MRRLIPVIAFLATAAAPGCAGTPRTEARPSAAATQCLNVVSWNDLHGQLEPDAPFVDTGRVPAGGVIALADHVATLRETGEPVVVLDAGDLFTGPMASSMAEGAPVIAAYRALGVDAAAIGNHEFDFGPVGYDRVLAKPGVDDSAGEDGPRGALLARLETASFPFLSANLRATSGAPLPWKNLHPHVVIDRGGFRVGVVGYTTDETPETTLRPNVDGLTFASGAAQNVAASVRALRAQGASPVILLAHASLDGELPQSLHDPDDPEGDRQKGEIARLLAGVGKDLPDLVVAGHRHAWMLGKVRGVPIVSTDQHGVGYARTRFCKDPKSGRPAIASIERVLAFAPDEPATPLGRQVASVVKPWVDAMRARGEELVTVLPRLCLPQGPAGTGFAEQVARAMLETARASKLVADGAPAVAVINAGGIRAALFPGPLRVKDVFAALPFENALATCTTTRKGLTRALANLVVRMSSAERFPFGVAGATVKAARGPVGALELRDVTLAGGAVASTADEPLTLVMPDFLLHGGDGFLNGVECVDKRVTETRIRDAFRAIVTREKGGCDGAPQNIQIEVP